MFANAFIQCGLYLVALLLLAIPLGRYMARVYEGKPVLPGRIGRPFENLFYKLCGVNPEQEMSWKRYAAAAVLFSVLGFIVLYALQRLQAILPLNPTGMGAVEPALAFNTAASFVTNTNWQSYGGESTMSYLTQMAGLTMQNFVSAATGMAVLVALIRGFTRHSCATIGNFWVDLTRSVLYILLPLSLVLALVLVSQGVVQTFAPSVTAQLIEPVKDTDGKMVKEQTIAVGPAASQIAIKQLGTNGGGFFNANSAHPFENPTPLANFLELLAILLIPAALCHTFGAMVGDRRQGWALLTAMTIIFCTFLVVCQYTEHQTTGALAAADADQAFSDKQSVGNMEGKEVRFGIVNSALWATATTAASNGSVNAMHDSFTPLGGLVPLWLMQLGGVVFGGVGCGLYGMLLFAILGVFVAGLMVGRTPEYLGKKIGTREMKMACIGGIIAPHIAVLLGTALAVLLPSTIASLANPGPHGFSEVLYAFSSAANNNGSAFAGLNANTAFFNTALGFIMLIGRFWVMLPVLAIAGALASGKSVPPSSGTLPTHGPLFVFLLITVVVIAGALSYIPALALGPVAEHLLMTVGH